MVAFVAILAGPGPAALASVLTFVCLQYPLLSPGYPVVLQFGEILRLGLFIVASALVVALSAARNKTSASLQRLRHNQQTMIRQLQEQNGRLRVDNAEPSEAAVRARGAEQEIRLIVARSRH
jgi:K+-sensing histidine kinase KdpD